MQQGARLKCNSQVESFLVFAGKRIAPDHSNTEAKFPSLRCSHIAKENPGLKAGDRVVLHGENHLNVKVLPKVPGC